MLIVPVSLIAERPEIECILAGLIVANPGLEGHRMLPFYPSTPLRELKGNHPAVFKVAVIKKTATTNEDINVIPHTFYFLQMREI
jgi:hypothetical protein